MTVYAPGAIDGNAKPPSAFEVLVKENPASLEITTVTLETASLFEEIFPLRVVVNSCETRPTLKIVRRKNVLIFFIFCILENINIVTENNNIKKN